jgi:hypothetical protein
MQLSGICAVCGSVANPAFSCSMCGLIICSKCFDKDRKVCKFCTRRMRLSGKT